MFVLQGFKVDLVFALQTAISQTRANFQNCHIWAWNLVVGQNGRSWRYTMFVSQRVKVEVIVAVRAAVCEIVADFQSYHIWAWNLAFSESAGSCTHTLFLRQGIQMEPISKPYAEEHLLIHFLHDNFKGICFLKPGCIEAVCGFTCTYHAYPGPFPNNLCSTKKYHRIQPKLAFCHSEYLRLP